MRVSTNGDRQVFDLERDTLLSAGVDQHHLFEDRTNGARKERAGLVEALDCASGLNLVVTAIILWNTRYLECAVGILRKSEDVPDPLLAQLSRPGWERVNLTGDYFSGVERSLSENIDGLRPLRPEAETIRKAA